MFLTAWLRVCKDRETWLGVEGPGNSIQLSQVSLSVKATQSPSQGFPGSLEQHSENGPQPEGDIPCPSLQSHERDLPTVQARLGQAGGKKIHPVCRASWCLKMALKGIRVPSTRDILSKIIKLCKGGIG